MRAAAATAEAEETVTFSNEMRHVGGDLLSGTPILARDARLVSMVRDDGAAQLAGLLDRSCCSGDVVTMAGGVGDRRDFILADLCCFLMLGLAWSI